MVLMIVVLCDPTLCRLFISALCGRFCALPGVSARGRAGAALVSGRCCRAVSARRVEGRFPAHGCLLAGFWRFPAVRERFDFGRRWRPSLPRCGASCLAASLPGAAGCGEAAALSPSLCLFPYGLSDFPLSRGIVFGVGAKPRVESRPCWPAILGVIGGHPPEGDAGARTAHGATARRAVVLAVKDRVGGAGPVCHREVGQSDALLLPD